MDGSVTAVTAGADTSAVLLLCGRIPAKRGDHKPLSAAEFHALSEQLTAAALPPAGLLKASSDTVERLTAAAGLEPARVATLLGRFDALGAALDGWRAQQLWVMSEFDDDYPHRLRDRLRGHGAPLLYGAGSRALLADGGVCVVGSRDSGADGLDFARTLGAKCGADGLTVVAADMRGVARAVTAAALDAGGRAVLVLSDSLEKAAHARRNRDALAAGTLALVTPFAPDTRFSVATAMRASRYQYALADVAVVVETRRRGGVWSGAEENRGEGWVPAFVRTGPAMAPGNTALLHLGLRPISQEDVEGAANLGEFFLSRTATGKRAPGPAQPAGVDLYQAFVGGLRAFVAAADRSEAEIAGHFGLERTQTRAWLRRAVGDGVLMRTGRPVRYRAPGASETP